MYISSFKNWLGMELTFHDTIHISEHRNYVETSKLFNKRVLMVGTCPDQVTVEHLQHTTILSNLPFYG